MKLLIKRNGIKQLPLVCKNLSVPRPKIQSPHVFILFATIKTPNHVRFYAKR